MTIQKRVTFCAEPPLPYRLGMSLTQCMRFLALARCGLIPLPRIEAHFIAKGMQGDIGGGGDADYVYILL